MLEEELYRYGMDARIYLGCVSGVHMAMVRSSSVEAGEWIWVSDRGGFVRGGGYYLLEYSVQLYLVFVNFGTSFRPTKVKVKVNMGLK